MGNTGLYKLSVVPIGNMFLLAVLIGVYSYLIFGLGLLGLLTPGIILGASGAYGVLCMLSLKVFKIKLDMSNLAWIVLGLIALHALVNLVGALGPELGFDALWYHLTIPKIWLLARKIFFISDGRYYYSVMPKLAEMTYILPLSVGLNIGPKIIHWTFGLLSTLVIYLLSRKWLSKEYSLLSSLIFYSNLVVGWQSTTAYVDLSRTFFEITALYLFINKSIYKSAIALGLAVCTKLLALGSLPIFIALLISQKYSTKPIIGFVLIVLLVPLPWFLFAYLTTGNPLYPVFSGYDLSSVRYWFDVVTVFIRSPDPLSPIYFMILPIVIIYYKKLPKLLILYSLVAIAVWWVTPRTGGGRFILPYLPAFSVLASFTIKEISNKFIKQSAIAAVVLVFMISLAVRGIANWKNIPVILGYQTQEDFLEKNLDHQFGNNFFYLPDPLSH
jgi:hypothetical protein